MAPEPFHKAAADITLDDFDEHIPHEQQLTMIGGSPEFGRERLNEVRRTALAMMNAYEGETTEQALVAVFSAAANVVVHPYSGG